MKNETYDKLVALFIERNAGEVEAECQLLLDAFSVKTFEEIQEVPDYARTYPMVRDCRAAIDQIVKSAESAQEQVIQALDEIWKALQEERPCRHNTLSELTRKVLYPGWTPEAQADYDFKYSVIARWRDYFVSYTNRDAETVNRDFSSLIRRVFLKPPAQKKLTETNYVARVLAKLLSKNDLRGFFDHNDIQCGDEIEEKVRDFCRKTFAFVQLVEQEAFRRPAEESRNWCFEEYSTFLEASGHAEIGVDSSDRFFFFVAGQRLEDLRPANFTRTYQEWFDHIGRVDHVQMAGLDRRALRDEIRIVARSIVDLRSQAVESLLAG